MACAFDRETEADQSIITFSQDDANSILEEGGYTPATTDS